MIDIKEKQETDPIENYKGKWAICYVLDNGSTVYSYPGCYKDTEQEKLNDIEECKEESLRYNLSNRPSLYLNYGKIFACMFNSKKYKKKAKSYGYPICISMFPIPVGE